MIRLHIIYLGLFLMMASGARAWAEEPEALSPPGQGQRWDEEKVPSRKVRSPQEPADTTLCIIGRPRPWCATILLLEISGRWGTAPLGAVDFGVLVNQGQHRGFGLTIGTMGYGETQGGAGNSALVLKARYRHWLSSGPGYFDGASLDLGVGAMSISGIDGVRAQGAIGEVAFQVGDLFAVTAGLHSWPVYGEPRMEMGATAGIRLGLGVLQFPIRLYCWLDSLSDPWLVRNTC